MQLRLLAIIWIWLVIMMTMTIGIETEDLVERNRRVIGSLFTDSPRREDFNLFGNNNQKNSAATTTIEVIPRASVDCSRRSKLAKRSLRKSIENIPGPELFQDPSSDIIDPESLKPHVRVKRRANLRRSIDKTPSYVHRIPRRTYERFLSEEMNPADESEAEYGSNLDDDIDVPGAFLNDEMTIKRNNLEDVYPDVKNHHIKRDHSAPEFLRPTIDPESASRLKREKERNNDCEDEEEGEEYYYDEEDETSNLKGDEQESEAMAPKLTSTISTLKESADQLQLASRDTQNFNNDNKNTKVKETNRLNSPVKQSLVDDIYGKPVMTSAARKSSNNNKRKIEKPKPKRKPPTVKKKPPPKSKPHPQKQLTKGKTRPKAHVKSKITISKLVDNENENEQLKDKDYVNCCDEVAETGGNKENGESLQINEKTSDLKKLRASKSEVESQAVEYMSMGEVKNLLARLINKVDDLHNLVSEIRSNRVDRTEGNSDRINCVSKVRRRTAGT